MINNVTDRLANSTQPALSLACPFLGEFTWQQEYLTPTTFIILVVVVCIEMPMCLVAILLNLLVILAVKRKRYLRKQKSCALLACLAATDCIVGAFIVALVIISHILRLSEEGPVCLLDKIIVIDSMYITCGASLYHLVIISGERCVGIKHALHYETLFTTRRLTIAVAAAWAIPVLFTTATNTEVENYPFQEEIENVITLVCIPGSVAVITFFQVTVVLATRRHRKHIRAHQVSEAVARGILKKDKTARTTTMIVVALCMCYAPPTLHQATILTAQNLPKRIAWGSFVLQLPDKASNLLSTDTGLQKSLQRASQPQQQSAREPKTPNAPGRAFCETAEKQQSSSRTSTQGNGNGLASHHAPPGLPHLLVGLVHRFFRAAENTVQ